MPGESPDGYSQKKPVCTNSTVPWYSAYAPSRDRGISRKPESHLALQKFTYSTYVAYARSRRGEVLYCIRSMPAACSKPDRQAPRWARMSTSKLLYEALRPSISNILLERPGPCSAR